MAQILGLRLNRIIGTAETAGIDITPLEHSYSNNKKYDESMRKKQGHGKTGVTGMNNQLGLTRSR